MGEVIQLSPQDLGRVCDECVYAAYGRSGIFCELFRENIFDAQAAYDCEGFERDA